MAELMGKDQSSEALEKREHKTLWITWWIVINTGKVNFDCRAVITVFISS